MCAEHPQGRHLNDNCGEADMRTWWYNGKGYLTGGHFHYHANEGDFGKLLLEIGLVYMIDVHNKRCSLYKGIRKLPRSLEQFFDKIHRLLIKWYFCKFIH
jgi:hypothetical protein